MNFVALGDTLVVFLKWTEMEGAGLRGYLSPTILLGHTGLSSGLA